jgi:hypothetical protein
MARHALALALLFVFPLGLVSCATSAPAPTGPVELDGTKWKLVMIGGSLDGRVIGFKKKGKDGYIGTLLETGRQLQAVVGLELGREIFSIQKKSDKEYQGVYKHIDKAGNISEREVIVFVDGNNLTWNQESAVWERTD